MSTALTVAPPDAAAEPSAKRRQMLDAAVELFMALGYGAVSMDAVARAAGVSKATLYAHFTSKDRLFATIVGEACKLNTIREDNFPLEVADIGALLRNIGRRVLGFLFQERTLAIYRVVMAEGARFPELGEAFINRGPQAFRDRFTAWIAAQCEAGRLAAADPQVAAEQFMALLRTSLFMRATLALPPAPTEADIENTVDAAVDTFLRAFSPRGT